MKTAATQEIQEQYPGWAVWQGVNSVYEPSDRCWVASLKDREYGVDPTVVAHSAEEALDAQRRRARGWEGPL